MNRLFPIAKKMLVILLASLALAYAGDFIWLRYRMLKPAANNPFESVKLDRYYAIAQKNGRVNYEPADPEIVTCVHSLFPHAGHNPCWYVVRQNGKPIPMAIFLRFRWNVFTTFLRSNETFPAFLRLLH